MKIQKLHVRNSILVLLRILLLAIIGVVIGTTFISIGLKKNYNDNQHDAERSVDVTAILNSIYMYTAEFKDFPVALPETPTEICALGSSCDGMVDLHVLVDSGYLRSLPIDPIASVKGTGYSIAKGKNGKITIMSLRADHGSTVSVTW